MAKARTVKDLKQLVFRLFGLADPRSIPGDHPLLATVLRLFSGGVTLNHAFLACIIAGLVWPDRLFTIGPGWAGWKHGQPYALPGEQLTGSELLIRAIVSERHMGMHGRGREWNGYADAYRSGYLLVLRHGFKTERKIAADLLSIALLIDYLLTVPGSGGDVVELGGRATGKVADDLSHLQRLWRGWSPDFGEHDWVTAPRMWKGLTAVERSMVASVPTGPKEAIAVLERLAPVLPCGFEWRGYEDGSWTGEVLQKRPWFVQQRTGETALIVSADRDGAWGSPDSFRTPKEVDEVGLAHVYRVPTDRTVEPPAPGKPSPPPRSEEPEPPGQEPDLAAGVRAVIAWAKDPQTAKGRGAKSALAETAERLEGLL